ncbi:MAG: hypothetical protein KDI75_04205 [Xanthomonadales bacterium]|nr:hypothetical protein [Xanthomonadales bacterium]
MTKSDSGAVRAHFLQEHSGRHLASILVLAFLAIIPMKASAMYNLGGGTWCNEYTITYGDGYQVKALYDCSYVGGGAWAYYDPFPGAGGGGGGGGAGLGGRIQL